MSSYSGLQGSVPPTLFQIRTPFQGSETPIAVAGLDRVAWTLYIAGPAGHDVSKPMGNYILRRLLLIPPTLLGIMALNFAIVQVAPGGPIDQIVAQLLMEDVSPTARIGGSGGGEMGSAASAEAEISGDSPYTGSRGIDPELIAELERQFGFDKPMHVRFVQMIWNLMRFDLGDSFYQDVPVVQLVIQRMPVSISLGLWSMLIIYSISILRRHSSGCEHRRQGRYQREHR